MLKEELSVLREELIQKMEEEKLEQQKPKEEIIISTEEISYDMNKTNVLFEEVMVGIVRSLKANPMQNIIKISCNPDAKYCVCIGNNNVFYRTLDKIDLDYLVNLGAEKGIEVVPSYDKDQLMNIDFILDLRTEQEKQEQEEMNQIETASELMPVEEEQAETTGELVPVEETYQVESIRNGINNQFIVPDFNETLKKGKLKRLLKNIISK